MRVVGYPDWLERWWIERACRHYEVNRFEDCAPRLEACVQRLSDSFTVDRRETYGDYHDDPELALAYGLFFLPQTFVRVQFPLAELVARGWNPAHSNPLRLLDLGAGAGAAGFGAALQLQTFTQVDVHGTAVDHSGAALTLQQSIAVHFPRQAWTILRKDLSDEISIQQADLIVVSFALNELGPDADRVVDPLLQQLSPQGMLLILEPALKETSERLESLRDRVAAGKRYHIWAPCLHSEPCPLLRGGEFWCHEVRKWKVPESVAYLNRKLQRSIDVLKFSFLAISRTAPPALEAGPQKWRLVSPFIRTKGKWIGAGCAADGQRYEYEILRRALTPKSAQSLQQLERGDVLHGETQPAGKAFRLTKVPG